MSWSFPCNVFFTIFKKSSFQTLSRRFVGLNDACVFCLVSIRSATSFLVLSSPWSCETLLLALELPTFSAFFFFFFFFFCNSFFKLRICWINELNTARNLLALSSFGFSIAHFLFFFSSRCFWHVVPYLWPKAIKSGCRLFFRQTLPRPCVSIWKFFVQYGESLNPVHVPERSRFPSIFQ